MFGLISFGIGCTVVSFALLSHQVSRVADELGKMNRKEAAKPDEANGSLDIEFTPIVSRNI